MFKKFFKLFSFLAFAAVLAGCDKAPSNIHVLTTENCGADWKVIGSGQSVPKNMMACSYNTSLPAWAMAGDTEFRVQFERKVASKVIVSYMYEITDPIAYIKEARFLGKMGGSLELSSSNIGSRFEMAENIIIDRTIREVTVEHSRNVDLINVDLKSYEKHIEDTVIPLMKKKGIALNDVAVVVMPDEMTRVAIDTISALRVLESGGKEAVDKGMALMTARAGAPSIHVEQSNSGKDK